MRRSIPTGASGLRKPASTLSIASSEFFITRLLSPAAPAVAPARGRVMLEQQTHFFPELPPSPPFPVPRLQKEAEHGALSWAISPARTEQTSGAALRPAPHRLAHCSRPGSRQSSRRTAPAVCVVCDQWRDSTQYESARHACHVLPGESDGARERERRRPERRPRPLLDSAGLSRLRGIGARSVSPREPRDQSPTGQPLWKTTPN